MLQVQKPISKIQRTLTCNNILDRSCNPFQNRMRCDNRFVCHWSCPNNNIFENDFPSAKWAANFAAAANFQYLCKYRHSQIYQECPITLSNPFCLWRSRHFWQSLTLKNTFFKCYISNI